jgi:hypothetical protein
MYGARSAHFAISRDEMHHGLLPFVRILIVVMYGAIKF